MCLLVMVCSLGQCKHTVRQPMRVTKFCIVTATSEIFDFRSFRSRSSFKTGQDAEEDNGQNELDDELQRTSLHLYILNYSSPVLMLTRTAWNNYLVVI